MNQRTIIVGDIHGTVDELTDLLSVDRGVGLTKDDTLVLVGDLVDKGPVEGSVGVVRLLSSLRADGYSIILVKGNHEEKHERFRQAFAKAGDNVKMKHADEMKEITLLLSEQDIAFLESAVLFHQIPEHNALVVHAGILPSMKALPTPEEMEAMSKGEISKLSRILRLRYVRGKALTKMTVEFDLDFEPVWDEGTEIDAEDIGRATGKIVKKVVRPKGDFLAHGQNGPDDPYWAQVYDGRLGHVYFGHEPFHEESSPMEFEHATGLDLGAVFGNRLAAVVLTGNLKAYVSVPAHKQYADKLNLNEE